MPSGRCSPHHLLTLAVCVSLQQIDALSINIGVLYMGGTDEWRLNTAVAQVNASIQLYLAEEEAGLPDHLNTPLSVTRTDVSLPRWDAFNLAIGFGALDSESSADSYSVPLLVLHTCLLCREMDTLLGLSGGEPSPLSPTTPLCVCDSQAHEAYKPCVTELREQEAMQVILDHLQLANLVVFYDESIDSGMTQTVDAISDEFTSLVFVDINETLKDGALESILLENLRLNEIRNFVISTRILKTVALLRRTLEINLLGPEFNWLVDMRHDTTGDGRKTVKHYMHDGDNTAVVTTGDGSLTPEDVLYEYVKTSIARLLMLNDSSGQNSTVNRTRVVLSVGKCLTTCSGINDLTLVAEVNQDMELLLRSPAIFPETFEGFNNRLFNVVTKHYPPFVVRNVTNGTVTYSGLCMAMLDVLAGNLNFRYEIHEVPDGKFGVKNDTGSWNGMIGAVHRQQFDFAAAALTIDSGREEAVDFTFPYWEEPSTVLIRPETHDPITIVLWIFKPLQWSTWILTVLAIFAVAGLLLFFTSISKRITNQDDPMTHYGMAFWYCFGAFIQQGGYKEPACFAGRVIAGCWWFMVIVIYAIYTGNLIAFLTVSKSMMPFNTLEAMAAQTEYYYGLEDGIIHMQLFKEAPEGTMYAKLWEGISGRTDAIVANQEEGLKKVKGERYGYIGEKTPMLTDTATDCSIAFIKEEFFKSGFGFAMPEGWPYTKYFNRDIMWLVESGFIEHWKREYWPQERCDLQSTTILAKAITLEELSGSYYILLCGVFISSCFLVGEHLLKRKRRKSVNLTPTHARERDLPGGHMTGHVTSTDMDFQVTDLDAVSRSNKVDNPIYSDGSDSDENRQIPRLNNQLSPQKEDNITNSFTKRSKPVINRNDWEGSVKRLRPGLRNHKRNTEINRNAPGIHHKVSALHKDIPVNGVNEHVI